MVNTHVCVCVTVDSNCIYNLTHPSYELLKKKYFFTQSSIYSKKSLVQHLISKFGKTTNASCHRAFDYNYNYSIIVSKYGVRNRD